MTTPTSKLPPLSSYFTPNPRVDQQNSQWDKTLMAGIRGMFERHELCDTVLRADGQEVLCHRLVLAAASPYFHAMFAGGFSEKGQTAINLNEISADSLNAIMEFIYHAKEVVNNDNAQDIFAAAHMLQLASLQQACSNFIENNIDDVNCLPVMNLGNLYNCTELVNAARSHAQKRLGPILLTEEFLSYRVEEVTELLSLQEFMCPDTNEQKICEAALAWIQHDKPNRQKHAFQVLRHVRFAQLYGTEYYADINLKSNSLLRGSPGIAALLEQVDYLQTYPDRWHETELVFAERACRWLGRKEERVVIFSGLRETDKLDYLGSYPDFVTDYMAESGHNLNWPADTLLRPHLVTGKGGKKLYLLQGSDSARKPKNCMYSFDGTQGFVNEKQLPTKRAHFSVVALDETLYIIGGSQKNTFLDVVEEYQPGNATLKTVARLPHKLRSCCCVAYRGKIYVFGGQTSGRALSSKKPASNLALCYDPGRNNWTELNPMKTARACAGCAIYRGKIYVIGGISDELPKSCMSKPSQGVECSLASCEVYDPQKDTWTDGPALPQPLATPGVVKFYGTIQVVGGVSPAGSNYDVYVLTEGASHWKCQKGALNRTIRPVTPTIHSTYAVMSLKRSDVSFTDDFLEYQSDSDGIHYDIESGTWSEVDL